MISVIIPFKDDNYLLNDVLSSVGGGVEVIIVDDASHDPPDPSIVKRHPNVRVLTNAVNMGVGYSFDRGVLEATGDVLLLMGSDVLLRDRSWPEQALSLSRYYPKSIICSVCVGLSESTYRWEGKTRRHGADIIFRATASDLPPASPLRDIVDYSDILQCRWIKEKRDDKPYCVPSVLGAAYIVRRDWYLHIGGWGWLDEGLSFSREERKWMGHKKWGGLEPMISLKSWFAGGDCMVDPGWETGHIFGRGNHIKKTRARRMDMYWFNKLYSAHTLFSSEEASILDNHLPHGRNQNTARTIISRNNNIISHQRDYNNSIKQRDYSIFVDRFGYGLLK
jgi:glycosyltransferase involved in cell wall biosynthesis